MHRRRYFINAVIFSLVLSGVLCFNAPLTHAHHSPARFADNQTIEIDGTVVRVDWKNPHVYIVVADRAGKEWHLESNATSNLRRNGWNKDSFTSGDRVFFKAHPNVDSNKTHVSLLEITGVDGKTYTSRIDRGSVGSTAGQAAASSLEGIWSGDGSLAFRFLFSTFDHPLTERAEIARARYDESMDPAADCVVWPSPRLVAWNAFYPVNVQFENDVITFTSEYGNTVRTVHMDGREHPQEGERTNQGHSIGNWDGATLVVDTRLFADHISPIADGIPSGANKHVVERYTLSEDGSSVQVDIVLEDPDFLAEPLSGQLEWLYAPQMEFSPFTCDSEAARRFVQ